MVRRVYELPEHTVKLIKRYAELKDHYTEVAAVRDLLNSALRPFVTKDELIKTLQDGKDPSDAIGHNLVAKVCSDNWSAGFIVHFHGGEIVEVSRQ